MTEPELWVVEVLKGKEWVPDSVWSTPREADIQKALIEANGHTVRVTRGRD